MTHKERILAAGRGEVPDRISWIPRMDLWYNASGADGNVAPNRTITNSAGMLDKSRALSFISG